MTNNIILASSSPRRIEIINRNGYYPSVEPADINEDLPFKMTPEAAVMYLAFKKACHVFDNTCSNGRYTVIGADTVVVHEGRIIGKPEGQNEVFKILSLLRASAHQVITGVSVIFSDGHLISKKCFYDTTLVFFGDYTDEDIAAYAATPEPYDKAGGYAIQGTFGKYVDHIEGDLDNVIGLPWYKVEPFLR